MLLKLIKYRMHFHEVNFSHYKEISYFLVELSMNLHKNFEWQEYFIIFIKNT